MLATLVVDAAHLLADPVHDPARCSIGVHPLHTAPAVAVYAALFVLPLVQGRRADGAGLRPAARVVHLVGAGLLLHTGLGGIVCLA